MQEHETQENYWDYMGRRLKEEKTHTVTVEADDNGELFLPIPVDLLNQMGWDFGDTLIWEENFDRTQKTYTIRKKGP
mgnify:FL=1|jgi:hypothetical protein|tara:strand:- start:448 stop:678 length:231 start_codon:yes stop_codon:yes gene_type:complete